MCGLYWREAFLVMRYTIWLVFATEKFGIIFQRNGLIHY